METKDLMLKYLDEAHAMETALVATLQAHIAMAPDGRHKTLLERHLRETRDQVQNIDTRRSSIGAEDEGRGIVAAAVGTARDVVGQGLSLAKGPIDAVRAQGAAERTLKNAKDECATEALEIATYEALEAAARACGDTDTAKLAAEHRRTEERMLSDLRKLLPKLAEATLTDLTGVRPQRRSKSTRSRSTTRRTSAGRAKSTSPASKSSSTRSSTAQRKTAAKGGAKRSSKSRSSSSATKSGSKS